MGRGSGQRGGGGRGYGQRGGGGRGYGQRGGGGRGSFRGGRGNPPNRRRGGGGNQSTSMSHRDASHMRQFGEKHPSEELGRDFGAPPEKRGKFGSRGRGQRGGFKQGSHRDFEKYRGNDYEGAGATRDESSSESSEEEEVTPYNELLTAFTGKKAGGPVQIVSDEEDEEDDSNEEDTGGSDVDDPHDVQDINDDDVESEDSFVSAKEELEIGDDDESDKVSGDSDNEGSEHEVANAKGKGESSTATSSELLEKGIDEDHDDGTGEDLEEEDETIIEDAELDPEINETDDTKDVDGLDPFVQHFEREMGEKLRQSLKEDKPTLQKLNFDWPVIERVAFVGLAKCEDEDIISDTSTTINISELDKLPPAKVPEPPLIPLKNTSLTSLHIKSQLHETIPIANQANIDKESSSHPLTALQRELFDMASRYHDVYFPKRTINNAEEIRMAYCLHAANHVLKTRSRILHHNARMSNKTEVPESYRDQGFVRPKVLILVPFKDSALRIVKTIITLVLKEEKGNVANKKRFVDDFGGQSLFVPKTNPKPEDYTITFNGNVEDNFKIGMAITKKSIKLYTGFYSSDIIVASPLGLRVIIGAEGEKYRDYDFLSSIELLIMDQSDVFIMQNWDHVLHLMKHLHLQPVTTHGTDFARIRPWALDGVSKFYFQTLMFSSMACPEHSSLLSRYCKNYAGQVRIMPTTLRGSICQVTVQLPQVFQNFAADSIHDVDEKRFEYFTKHVLPNFKGKLMSHTLIFVPSYFDFVRLRNFFKREEVSFVQICEYTKDKKIARSRDLFFHGANHFMLYTERVHFFKRLRLKGIGHIIFYQLPQNPHFYPELCNFIQENSQNRRVRQRKNSSVNVIYCKYDTPRLAPIVGTERASYMLNSEKNIHAFVSGEL